MKGWVSCLFIYFGFKLKILLEKELCFFSISLAVSQENYLFSQINNLRQSQLNHKKMVVKFLSTMKQKNHHPRGRCKVSASTLTGQTYQGTSVDVVSLSLNTVIIQELTYFKDQLERNMVLTVELVLNQLSLWVPIQAVLAYPS